MLTIRYEPDASDEVGELWFDLKTDSFSGKGFFWSNLAELPEMIRKLKCYPLGDPARWTWGYNAAEGADLILALSIAQDGHTGGLKVVVEIADIDDTSCRVSANFGTSYNALDDLSAGLKDMGGRRAGEALLLEM